MKYSNANTLNTQRFIARYGKAARYPVCQAAIRLWGLDADLEEGMKKAVQIDEDVNSAKRQKKQVLALYEQLYKEGGRQKEVIQAEALLQKINEHLPKLQMGYGAQVAYCLMLCRELRPVGVALFEREKNYVVRTKDTKALRALKLVKQRWGANPSGKGARLRAGDQRELEILKMLRDRVINAAWAKGEARAGYLEAFRGSDRPLSDEVWQGRLTVKEIHLRLMTAGGSRLAGDKDGKEIRRILTRLGIRPAEEQRGRKWKLPLPKKQEPKRTRGRTRTRPEIVSRNLEAVLAMEAKIAAHGDGLKGLQIYEARQEIDLKQARQVIKSIDREIARLSLRRGGRKGQFVY